MRRDGKGVMSMTVGIREIGLSETDRESRMKIAKTLGLIFVFLSLLILFFMIRSDMNALSSSTWPTVKGEVMASKVVLVHGGASGHSTLRYIPAIQYKYVVDGVSFFGDRVYFASDAGGESFCKEKVENYPVGKSVNVFYNSNDPKESVLEPGISLFSILMLGIINLVFIILFLLAAYAMFRDYQRVKDARFENGTYFIKA